LPTFDYKDPVESATKINVKGKTTLDSINKNKIENKNSFMRKFNQVLLRIVEQENLQRRAHSVEGKRNQ
jgi:hypothetical protein